MRVDALLTGAEPETVEACARIADNAAAGPRLWLRPPFRAALLANFGHLRLGIWTPPDECASGPRWIRTRLDGRLSVCLHTSTVDDGYRTPGDSLEALVLEGVPASAFARIAGPSRAFAERSGAAGVGLVLPISYGPAEVALDALRARISNGAREGWWRRFIDESFPEFENRASDAAVRDFGAVSDQALCDRIMLADALGFAAVVLAPVAPVAERRDGERSADLHAVRLAAQLNGVLAAPRPASHAPADVR